jgi:hypothetical protein
MNLRYQNNSISIYELIRFFDSNRNGFHASSKHPSMDINCGNLKIEVGFLLLPVAVSSGANKAGG